MPYYKSYMSLTSEQIATLVKISSQHVRCASIWSVEHGHIEVEFEFPNRYFITKTGTLFKCYDLEYNKYREITAA